MYFLAGLFALGAVVVFAIALDASSREDLIFSVVLFFFACVIYGIASIRNRLPEERRD